MLKVDGVVLPTPTSYLLDFEEISDAARNARGKMIKKHIANKYKLNLTWKVLTQAEITKLMNTKRKSSFMLEFISMDTGQKVTGEFYAGSISANGVQYKNGRIDYWTDIKINFIEM